MENTEDTKCQICNHEVTKRQHALWCDNCNRWNHQRCMGMTPIKFRELRKSKAKWFCESCVQTKHPTSYGQDQYLSGSDNDSGGESNKLDDHKGTSPINPIEPSSFILTPARIIITPAPSSTISDANQSFQSRTDWDFGLNSQESYLPVKNIDWNTSPDQPVTNATDEQLPPLGALELDTSELPLPKEPANIPANMIQDPLPPTDPPELPPEESPSEGPVDNTTPTDSPSSPEAVPLPSKIPIFANLPSYKPIETIPTTSYNGVNGAEFAKTVADIYNETVKWKKNLFQVPSGQHGKAFLKLLNIWLRNFNEDTCFQGIALKTHMVLPAIMLQKPSPKSKAKDHNKVLAIRLQFWQEGKLGEILSECRIIQHKLTTSTNKTPADISRIFSKLMFLGKVKAALKFLDSNSETGILQPTEDVINTLKEKHPEAAEIQPETLIQGPITRKVNHAHFAVIDEQMVMKAAMRTRGSAGPSQFDSDQYRRVLCSKHFKSEGKELREQISIFARKIATQDLDPHCLGSYVACRLIPLNKNPGVRPIGVGEVMRRIVGKMVAWSLKEEIQHAAGPLQMSSGLNGGAEAAIHAMRNIFEADNTDAVILVDASNAFNKLNRQAALHNIRYICPPLATILINTYREPARLFIAGGKEIKSSEGTTQGDPLAMQFYALGTNPLIEHLRCNVPNVSQVWLADDASGAGKLNHLKEWWVQVKKEGSKLGYHVNEGKSWLILKRPEDIHLAKEIFHGTNINTTITGKRHLGAALGSEEFTAAYIKDKVSIWCDEINNLAKIAETQPHAAYSAYTHGQQHKYRYFMRTINNIEEYLKPLDDAINNILIPAITGFNINEAERELLSLPVNAGGLGLEIISQNANDEFTRSNLITGPLAAIIVLQGGHLPNPEEEKECRSLAFKDKQEKLKEKMANVSANLSTENKRHIDQAKEPGASSWLSALPLEKFNFNMNKSEFRDAVALRYNKHLNNLPSYCVCGTKFDVTHAMNCKRGGFINARHNNIRDFEASLLNQVCTDVESEPPLQPLGNEQLPRSANSSADARLDIRARGFWRRGQNAYFDVRVTNADSASQTNMSIKSVLKRHEAEKKRAYNQRVMQVEQGSFTPLVFTTLGCMGPEATTYHKTLAEKLSEKTGETYSHTINFIRCKLSFMAIRSALLCLRGSRGPVKKTSTEEGNDYGMYIFELNM